MVGLEAGTVLTTVLTAAIALAAWAQYLVSKRLADLEEDRERLHSPAVSFDLLREEWGKGLFLLSFQNSGLRSDLIDSVTLQVDTPKTRIGPLDAQLYELPEGTHVYEHGLDTGSWLRDREIPGRGNRLVVGKIAEGEFDGKKFSKVRSFADLKITSKFEISGPLELDFPPEKDYEPSKLDRAAEFYEVVAKHAHQTRGLLVPTTPTTRGIAEEEERVVANRVIQVFNPDQLNELDISGESWVMAVLCSSRSSIGPVAEWAEMLDNEDQERINFYLLPETDPVELFETWHEKGLSNPSTFHISSWVDFHSHFGRRLINTTYRDVQENPEWFRDVQPSEEDAE